MDKNTIKNAYRLHDESDSSATVISAEVEDSTGYGRIVRKDDGTLDCIVEHKDAKGDILDIKEINSGAYWFDIKDLLSVLYDIRNENKANEYYLPDALKLLLDKGKKVSVYKSDNPDTVLGANSPEQLEELSQIAINKGYSC